jgi:hypothetical protein
VQQRPISVTIFGILNIGFGVFQLMALLVTVLVFSPATVPLNPIMKQMRDLLAGGAWSKITAPFDGMAALALIAAGIGLLRLQNWARLVSIGCGIYGIASDVVGAAFMLKHVLREQGLFLIVMLVAILAILAIGLAYPVLLLIFMTRPKVVAAFSPAQSTP